MFDYVLLAYGVAFLTFSWVAYLIIQRDHKLRQLLDSTKS